MTESTGAVRTHGLQVEAAETGFWDAVREALRGSHANYTQGDIGRAVMLLAVPMVLEMVMESVFAVTDVFFVAKLGADAVATVGITESLLMIAYAIAVGLTIGVTAIVARRIGEQDRDGAARAAVQAIVLGTVVSAVLGVVSGIYAPALLRVMGAPESVIATGSEFARVMLGGQMSIMLLYLVNAVFRGAGDAAVAMRVLWVANAINIVLGPCLIFGVGPFPTLGVTGAAIATTIGRGTGACVALWLLFHGGRHIRVGKKHLHLEFGTMGRLVKLSASGTFQVFVGMASWIFLVRILTGFGAVAIAGYTIGIRVILFALFPSMGMSNAAATMVGQALGARDPDRAEQSVWRASLYNLYFLGVVGVLFVIFAPQIVHFFTSERAVAAYATDCLRIVAFGFPLYAYAIVVSQSFNGAGDTRTPTLINLGVFWVLELPLAYVLSHTLKLGPHGAFLAITIAFCTMTVVGVVLFKQGCWKRITV
jgi:putative MATE family efflux protein